MIYNLQTCLLVVCECTIVEECKEMLFLEHALIYRSKLIKSDRSL